jgi:hypothetical protein
MDYFVSKHFHGIRGAFTSLFLRKHIFAGVVIQLLKESRISFPQTPQALVCVHIVLMGIHDAHRYIGAVVGRALHIC